MTTTFEIPQVLDEIEEEISTTEEVGQEAGEIIDGEFEVEGDTDGDDDESQFNDDDELQMLDENGNEIADTPPSEAESAAESEVPAEPTAETAKSARQNNAEADYANRVEHANRTFIRAALYRAKTEAEAKFAKAQEKAALEELQAIVERGPEHMPLFDGMEPAKANKATEATEEAEPESASEVEADGEADATEIHQEEADKDESWRDVEVGELDLPSGIVNALIGANLETIGQLADFSAGDCQLIDIEGIGKAKAEKIENALEQFWAKRNESQSV